MGSYASSTSNTNYANKPVTVTDNENPLILTDASGNSIGNTNNSINGSTINSLDGGAIAKAFDFGTASITTIAELTKKLNETAGQASVQALSFADKTASAAAQTLDKNINASANSEIVQNKTLWILGALAVAGAYFYFKRG